MRSRLPLVVLIALLPVAMQSAPERVAVIENPAPAFPAELFTDSVTNGYALVACTIDDNGTVLDSWVVASSRVAFAEASESTLRTWRYTAASPEPAATASAPWPRMDVVNFDFSRSGQITTKTHREAMAGSFLTGHPPASSIEDIPVVPTTRVARLAGKPPSAPAGTPAGEVIVEFIVDRSGRVRLPVAIRSDHLAHARAAVASVGAWRFAALPPDIKTPAVRMRWLFRFPAKS